MRKQSITTQTPPQKTTSFSTWLQELDSPRKIKETGLANQCWGLQRKSKSPALEKSLTSAYPSQRG